MHLRDEPWFIIIRFVEWTISENYPNQATGDAPYRRRTLELPDMTAGQVLAVSATSCYAGRRQEGSFHVPETASRRLSLP